MARKIINSNDYWRARNNDPQGEYCGFCGNKNFFVDDCGWFYVESYYFLPPDIYIPSELKPCCEDCFHGDIGQLHIEKHGLGDR